MMADPLMAQSAIVHASTAHELIIEGVSYRCRQKSSIIGGTTADQEKAGTNWPGW